MKAIIILTCCFTALFQLLVIDSPARINDAKGPAGEIVYLHTDCSYYIAGESILFKGYILSDPANLPNPAGDSLVVTLIDQDLMEVAAGIFPIKKSQAVGGIALSKFLTEGSYVLVARTNRMKSSSPDKLFSKTVEVLTTEKDELVADITLKDTLYSSGSLLTAGVRFSGKEDKPVPASYTYQLSGNNTGVISGKGQAASDGTALITVQFPAFNAGENLKLIISSNYKSKKNITGIEIPVSDNSNKAKPYQGSSIFGRDMKQMNILIKTDKPQYNRGDKIMVDIRVTDDKGAPVKASLSVSASNPSPRSVGSQSSGKQYIVQEKNNLKKIRSNKETRAPQKQEGYPPNLSIPDALMQIKPYHINDGKIIFISSGVTTVNSQDGAIIVIDGINSGTDAQTLNDIPISDVAKITASTNVMDIQRYTGLNSVGVIEITMKKGKNAVEIAEPVSRYKSSAIFWEPDITTDSSGKASLSFLNNNTPSKVILTVEGIATNGLAGSSTVQYSVK